MSAKLLMPIMRKISPTNSAEKSAESSMASSDGREVADGDPPRTPTQSKRSASLTPTLSCPLGAGDPSSGAVAKDRYQLVFMGSGGVGKSALISRFLYDRFPARYKPTVEDMYATEFPMGHDLFTLELLDTSGTMPFPAMRALNIARGDGFVLVYSVTDPESFEEVRRLREEILAARNRGRDPSSDEDPVPIVVVGNKIDERAAAAAASSSAAADDDDGAGRVVPSITAETVVTIDWEHGFVEASALTGEGVVDIFRELLKQSRLRNHDLILIGAAMEKRRRSFPLCSDMPKRKDFQRKRNSCVIN